jgi:uncharacterized protein
MNNVAVVQTYFQSLATVIWHQPGNGALSGTYKGKDAVFGLFGRFMEISAGSFKIDSVQSIMANSDLVCATLHFSAAKKSGAKISMDGVDVMKIKDGKIQEVFLFSSDQAAEDGFWN